MFGSGHYIIGKGRFGSTLASSFLPGCPRNLAACCRQAGVPLVDAHRASADAEATARLLAHYLEQSGGTPPWESALRNAEAREWPRMPRRNYSPVQRSSEGPTGDFLSRLVESLPGQVGDAEHVEYPGMLDRALLDRHLSERERDVLVQLATDLGIDQERARSLHGSYLRSLATLAWADGVVTSEERLDLERVAELLGVPSDEVEAALAQPAAEGNLPGSSLFALCKGDRVVFTGQMKRSRGEWHANALAAGLEPPRRRLCPMHLSRSLTWWLMLMTSPTRLLRPTGRVCVRWTCRRAPLVRVQARV